MPVVRKIQGSERAKRLCLAGMRAARVTLTLLAMAGNGSAWAAPESGSSHWSFLPVVRPAVSEISFGPETVKNPVDAFVAHRLAREHLTLSPEADRVTLIRRLYFVVLGVPPRPDEVAAFLADSAPEAFERLVDRTLADSRYGERWGRHWLDVVRFAESNGFETNRERPNAWRYRDYVIAAFNRDLPYDEFIRQQIAGDSLGCDVATGFLVAGPVDIVGSPDPVLTAQQRADEIDDMVATTGTAFLGLTLGCARCHSHKFDPISHTEYYSMSALLSGVKHGERAEPLPPEREARLQEVDASIRQTEEKLSRFLQVPTAKTGELGPEVNARRNEETFPPIAARFVRFTIRATTGGEPCLDELEVWSSDRNVARATNGTLATASGTLPGYEIHQLRHINDGQTGNAHSWISSESGRGWVQLEFPGSETIERVVWGRDREGQFADRLAIDYVIEAAVERDHWQPIAGSQTHKPYSGPAGGPSAPVYHFEGLSETDARIGRAWLAELEHLKQERENLAKTPQVYSGTFSQPGVTHRFHRGDAMQPREEVPPATLALFRPVVLAPDAPERERRLQLANWIASPENPLTARVLVNRIWQHHFGVGLVDTPNDFGRNGSKPSHPELLDWLAAEWVRPTSDSPARPWSIKHLQRLILTSATWRQSSRPLPEGSRVDSTSRLLWRFPSRRLEAEAIRDSILSVSGQLDSTAGGPGFFLHDVDRENVYHYHPKEDFGPAEFRRMVYAFKVRMEQDGIFGSFDCPDGSLVAPRRSISTTPLQALNLFNSRFMLAQAEAFATRLRNEAGGRSGEQVRKAWQIAYNREPAADEAVEASNFVASEGLPALCRAVLNSNEFLFIP